MKEAPNQHSISRSSKGYLRNTSFPSGCLSFQFPLHHGFCTQTKIEAKTSSARTSSAKSNSQPTRVRLSRNAKERDEALMEEATAYVKFLNDAKGEDGFLKEKSKLSITPKLGFCGKVSIDLEDGAIDRANAIIEGNTDQCHHIFFVDGSFIAERDAETGSLDTSSGAAVVYKPLAPNQPWVERYFAPPKCEQSAFRIEIIAILNALKIAAVVRDLCRRCDPGGSDGTAAKFRVTIFSDCTNALLLLKDLKGSIAANSPLLKDGVVRELIAVSQYLDRKGVSVKLRWVRGHSKAKGNILADNAARYAARHPEISAILEKELQVTVPTSSSATKAGTPKDTKPSKKENKKKVPRSEAENQTTLPGGENLVLDSKDTPELQDNVR